jgi:hypothetical protein
MKVYRNITTIQSKEKFGRRLSLAGLLVLMIGLVVNFTPNWFPPDQPAPHALGAFLQQYWTYISMVSLVGGFLLASMGSYYINRFARRRWPGSKLIERPDEVLERSMKGFDDKYAYFAYSLPAAYTLVGPSGITILAARSDKGRVVAQGEKWREPFSLGRIFTVFAREGVGNPARDIADQEQKLRELLARADDKVKDAFKEVPVNGAAVFLNQDVSLEVDNPAVPVVRADQLKDFIRKRAKDTKLQASTLRDLTEYLVAASDFQEDGEE